MLVLVPASIGVGCDDQDEHYNFSLEVGNFPKVNLRSRRKDRSTNDEAIHSCR